MQIREYRDRDRLFKYTDHSMSVPAAAVPAMLGLLEKWSAVSPDEDTYAKRTYGIPSLFTRFDCVIDVAGVVRSYEIHGGCEWLGYAGIANPAFKKMRDEFVQAKWPPFKLLAYPGDKRDDVLWVEEVSMAEALRGDCLLLLRYSHDSLTPEQRACLIPRSIVANHFRLDKEYGMAFGWWREISDLHDLPWTESFALKPRWGKGSKDVMVWNANSRAGRSTKTQIEKVLRSYGNMYLQEFIPPFTIEIGNKPFNGMHRVYFGFNTVSRAWECMGGVWVARPYPNFRIHGASDAVSGPLAFDA